MTTVSTALLLLAALGFLVWRRQLHWGLALLGVFAGAYAAQTKWLGPHLYAIGGWAIRNLSHIRL